MSAENSGGGLEGYLARAGAAAAGGSSGGRLWREGREVGEWTVAGFVGRGGSAEAYCARHRRLGTAAVLKVLWRNGEGPRARFDRETRFLMESPGPSFPTFLGTGTEEGRPWVAMELLEEYSLPSTDASVAAYLLDVARGVEELHRRGWVHRDLKPCNILRREADGHAVLIDFGLLKRAGETVAAETAAGRVSPSLVDGREVGVGTPGYAAPEQFAGGAATPATDVHALGILADECFHGKPPRVWERIIRRATGSLPRQRYADAAAMARAIRRRHWPRNAAWLALACALGVAVAAWWPFSRTPLPSGPDIPEVTVVPSAPEVPVVPAAPEESPPPPPALDVRAARAAALARFEADDRKKEAIFDLVDDMEPCGYAGRVGRHEVTQRQWMALMDDNPSRFQGDDLPVDSLTVGACLEFLERLNATSVAKETARTYRLPTASELAGVASRHESETPEARQAVGWFAENAGGRTHPVGEKPGSGGCADLLGNVRELTTTWGEVDGKAGFLCMGGSWADPTPAGAIPKAVLEQPPFIQRFLEHYDPVEPGVDTLPSDYPHAACPAPGEIGFRLWMEPQTSLKSLTEEALKDAVSYWESEEKKERPW